MRIKKNYLSVITAAVCCLLVQTTSFAGFYKWVDQDGQVHYGEKPGNKDATTVPVHINDAVKPRVVQGKESKAEKNPDADKKAGQPAEAAKPKMSRQEKQRLCSEAKSDVAAITSRGRMRERNAKGEYTYLSDKQRQQRLAAARKKQRKYCR